MGFPNVRAAEDDEEVDALTKRVSTAFVSAKAKKSEAQLTDFSVAVLSSRVVIARNIKTLHSLVSSDSILLTTFHHQFASGERIPQNNEWDLYRSAAEGTIFPNYHQEINYAALSLDGVGATAYGAYSITFRDDMVVNRSSVFEENPFFFNQRHGVAAGQAPPKGYRASWANRNHLAVAKLHGAISANTQASEFAGILLKQGAGTGDVECIEVHTYGPLSRRAIERVKGPKPKRPIERVLWQEITRQLGEVGAVVEAA